MLRGAESGSRWRARGEFGIHSSCSSFTLGFPKARGIFGGVPIVKTVVFLDRYGGPLFGEITASLPLKFLRQEDHAISRSDGASP